MTPLLGLALLFSLGAGASAEAPAADAGSVAPEVSAVPAVSPPAAPDAPKLRKIGVSDLQTGIGADPELVRLVSTLLASELRKVPGLMVTSQEDVRSLLGLERQKQMLHCSDASCLAEIGGALGVDLMVTGSVSKLGDSLVLVLRAIDVRHAQVKHDVTRRLQSAKADAVLDVLPQMVDALFPAAAPAVVATPPPAAIPVPPAALASSAPPPAPRHPVAPWILMGAGAVVGAAGFAVAGAEFLSGGATKTAAGTTYTISSATANSRNKVILVGDILGAAGAVATAAGLTWGLWPYIAGPPSGATP